MDVSAGVEVFTCNWLTTIVSGLSIMRRSVVATSRVGRWITCKCDLEGVALPPAFSVTRERRLTKW